MIHFVLLRLCNLYKTMFLMRILCVYVCVFVCECVCQGDNRQSDGAKAGVDVLLFRGGGQSELTQERSASLLEGTHSRNDCQVL